MTEVARRPSAEVLAAPHPVLVLGLGNPLMGDDGAGLEMLSRLSTLDHPSTVDFVDGGTGGLGLLGFLAGRRALLILDAVRTGSRPGTVHSFTDDQLAIFFSRRGTTAHETDAGELIQTARLLGECPPRLALAGIEPAVAATGIGFSAEVAASMDEAVALAKHMLNSLVEDVA